MTAKRGPKRVSSSHKAAMAQGRVEGFAVRRYLEALQAQAVRRGPRRSREVVEARVANIDEALLSVGVVEELALRQQRRSLEAELAGMAQGDDDVAALADRFCEVAANYSARKGIDYATWREMGVPAAVLRTAGLKQHGRVESGWWLGVVCCRAACGGRSTSCR